jgi:uncharacterized protein (TIGR02300 family)
MEATTFRTVFGEGRDQVVKLELGTKRLCPSCAARFYDLSKEPIECPKCGTTFFAEAILPSKAETSQPAPAPREKVVVVEEVSDDADTISLEEVEEEEDETAAVKDVDIDDDATTIAGEDDDAFLEEEEEDGANVTDIIVGGKGENEEI